MNQDEITTLLQEFLEAMQVSFETIEPVPTGPHILFLISSSESKALIGSHGEHLRALNYAVKKIIERRFGEDVARTVTVDVNGYQRRRIEEVQNNARMLAERVRLFRSRVDMTPMNAYERMIVHELFSQDSSVMTESEGEGPHRHVVIKFRGGDVVDDTTPTAQKDTDAETSLGAFEMRW